MMLANILFYITGTGPPVTGFSNFGQPTGFSTSLPQPAAFGNFGTATTTASGFKGNYFLASIKEHSCINTSLCA